VNLLAVGMGGALGALARYGLSGLAHRLYSGDFPLGTLAVNVLGCVAIGALAWMVEDRQMFGPEARLFVRIGFLGSLTTFSTFGHETFELLRDAEWLPALANVGANVLLGLTGVALGWIGAKALFG
jgi:CrcB protein